MQLVFSHAAVAAALLIQRYRVLLIDAELIDMRHYTEHGLARLFLEKVERRCQQRHVTTEFIDNKPLDEGTFLLIEQFECPHERGKCTAAVNVCDKQDRCLQMLCYTHIDNIICLEVDLGGASGPLDHKQIVVLLEAAKGFLNRSPRLERISLVVFTGAHVSNRLAHDDDL